MTNYEKERESVIGELEPMVVTNIGVKQKKKMTPKKKLIIYFSILVSCIIVGLFIFAYVKVQNWMEEIKRRKENPYVQQEMLSYLEEKYGEEFEMKSFKGIGEDYQTYAEMIAYPKKEGEKYTFQVQGYQDSLGSVSCYDTYVTVKLTDEYEEYLSSIIGQYYDEYKLHLTFYSLWVNNSLPVDTKLEDLWKMSPNVDYPLPVIFIFIPPEETDVNFEKLCQALQEGHFRGSLRVKHYKKRENYIKKDEHEWGEGVHMNFFVYSASIYDEDIEYYKVIEE